MLHESGKLKEAEASLRHAIALKSDFAEAHNNLGIVLRELGNLEDAQLSYTRAIALKPNYADAYNNLGIALKELGKPEKAEKILRQAIALKPDFLEAHYNLGILLYGIGKYYQASICFKRDRDKKSQSYLLKCSYKMDDPVNFYQQLDLLIDEGEINPTIGSLTMRAGIRYGVQRSNVFATNPFNYIVRKNLTSQLDFDDIFIQTIKSILSEETLSYRSQDRLSKGRQTAGNFFHRKLSQFTKLNKLSEKK